MCMFSGPVRYVGNTRIFARPLDDGRQALAYEMKVAQERELAMILPLPTPAGVAEDAVEFLDLSDDRDLFSRLDALFPAPVSVGGMMSFGGAMPRSAPLQVHTVGSFNASFVPRLADFDRLAPVFRLAPQIWDQLPQYATHSFCVFALRPPESETLSRLDRFLGRSPAVSSEIRPVHPMAFIFPRRNPAELFFPTLHVHDGEIHPTAAFDHSLFMQAVPSLPGWEMSAQPALAVGGPAARLLADGKLVQRRVLRGQQPNQDVIVAL